MLRPIAELIDFLENKMSMQAVYQPVVILHLLTRGGVSSRKDLARTLSGYDDMGLDYWDRVLMKNPKLTLVDTHKIIEYDQEKYIFRLNFDLEDIDNFNKAKESCEKLILKWIKRSLESQKLEEQEILRYYRVLSLAKCNTIQNNPSDFSEIDDFEVQEFAMQMAVNYLKQIFPDQKISQQPYNNPGFDILVGSVSDPHYYVKLISTIKIIPTFNISEYDRHFSIENNEKYIIVVVYSINLSDKIYRINIHYGSINLESFLLTPYQWSATLLKNSN